MPITSATLFAASMVLPVISALPAAEAIAAPWLHRPSAAAGIFTGVMCAAELAVMLGSF